MLTIDNVLADPTISAVRAQQMRRIERNPDAARGVFISRVYGRLPGNALALLGAVSLDRDARHEAARRFLSAADKAALDRVEAALPGLADRAFAPRDEAAEATARLDRVLPLPRTFDAAAEQARVADIRGLAKLAKATAEGERLIAAGASIEQARIALTNAAAAGGPEISTANFGAESAPKDLNAIAANVYRPKK
jgi:hypothetical protein